MENSSYFSDGDWNFLCAICGAKEKSSKATKTWDGFYVCERHHEMRNPQDFIRGRVSQVGLPWTRPIPADVFVPSFCTVTNRQPKAGTAVSGCAILGYLS